MVLNLRILLRRANGEEGPDVLRLFKLVLELEVEHLIWSPILQFLNQMKI